MRNWRRYYIQLALAIVFVVHLILFRGDDEASSTAETSTATAATSTTTTVRAARRPRTMRALTNHVGDNHNIHEAIAVNNRSYGEGINNETQIEENDEQMMMICRYISESSSLSLSSTTDDCADFLLQRALASIASSSANNSNTGSTGFHRVAFFGDSTMGRLWRSALDAWNTTSFGKNTDATACQEHVSDRCNTGNPLELPYQRRQESDWRIPVPMREGPFGYGFDHPGCLDCSSCKIAVWYDDCSAMSEDENATTVPDNKQRLQAMPPPFRFSITTARDVVLQTNDTFTTQETFGKYVLSSHKLYHGRRDGNSTTNQPYLCIANTGLHDMAIPYMEDATYVENVKFYLGILSDHCVHIIWLSTSATLNDRRRPQKNERIIRWNQMIEKMLMSSSNSGNIAFKKEQVTILDVYNLTESWPHKDNVHLERSFYDLLSQMLLGVMENIFLKRQQSKPIPGANSTDEQGGASVALD